MDILSPLSRSRVLVPDLLLEETIGLVHKKETDIHHRH
jgi:hypothetical protein